MRRGSPALPRWTFFSSEEMEPFVGLETLGGDRYHTRGKKKCPEAGTTQPLKIELGHRRDRGSGERRGSGRRRRRRRRQRNGKTGAMSGGEEVFIEPTGGPDLGFF